MGVTLFSLFLLPLSLYWSYRPTRLLQLLLVAAIFEAAAAFTIKDLGVQPGLVPAMVFIGYVALRFTPRAVHRDQRAAWRLCRPLVLVAAWGVAGSMVLPRVFRDQVLVWPEKMEPPFGQRLLEPSSSNFNQDVYLVLDMMILVAAATYLVRSRHSLRPFLNAYFLSGYLAAFVGLWQFAQRVAGVPFPENLFYSNPGWSILTGQTVGALPRINGSFSEPSSFGSYMAAQACCSGWLLMRGNRERVVRVLFPVSMLGVVLSTSTTGFATLAAASVFVLVLALVRGSVETMAALARIAVPLLLLAGVFVYVAIMVAPGILSDLNLVFNATLNKGSSSSYQDRTTADVDSISTMLDTYGLGVGWGSNRSSSLVPGMLASLGVPGVLGLVWFGATIAIRTTRALRANIPAEQATVLSGLSAALVGFLIAALISAPTVTTAIFYTMLGVLIAAVVRVEAEARAPQRVEARRAVPRRRTSVRLAAASRPGGRLA